MIRKAQDVEKVIAEKAFGGKGSIERNLLLKEGEFYDKGRLFSHVVLPPGSSLGNHTHTGDFETYYILKGEGVYCDNGTSCTVRAGDVAICKEGETHGLENTGTEDLEFIALILFTK